MLYGDFCSQPTCLWTHFSRVSVRCAIPSCAVGVNVLWCPCMTRPCIPPSPPRAYSVLSGSVCSDAMIRVADRSGIMINPHTPVVSQIDPLGGPPNIIINQIVLIVTSVRWQLMANCAVILGGLASCDNQRAFSGTMSTGAGSTAAPSSTRHTIAWSSTSRTVASASKTRSVRNCNIGQKL